MTEANANPDRPLGLYDELLQWSMQQPMWQRDALRRLVVNGDVTPQNILELADLTLGNDYTTEATRNPEPLTAAHRHRLQPSATFGLSEYIRPRI